MRGEVDGEFQQERLVVLHPVEIPAEAKGVERGAEGVGFASQVHAKNRAHIALCVHRAADDALVVAVRGDIELGLDALPLAVQLGVGAGGEFGLRKLRLRFHEVFVAAALDVEFMRGDGVADGLVRRLGQEVYNKALLGVEAFPFLHRSEAVAEGVVDVERPECRRDEQPAIKHAQPLVLRFRKSGVVAAQNVLRPLGSVIRAGGEFFQVAGKCFVHGLSAMKSVVLADFGNPAERTDFLGNRKLVSEA